MPNLNKKIVYAIVPLFVAVGTLHGTVYASSAEDTVNSVLSKYSDSALIGTYVSKLESIENRVLPTKESTYAMLVRLFKERYDALERNKKSSDGTIPSHFIEISSKVKKIVSVNDDYEFVENGRTRRLDLSRIIRLQNDPNFIRTVLRTYDVTKQVLIRKGDAYVMSIDGFSVEDKLDIPTILVKARKIIPKEPVEDGKGVLVYTSPNGSLLAMDTTKYSYFDLPANGFYLSSYSNLQQPKDWTIMKASDGGIKVMKEYVDYQYPFVPPKENRTTFLESYAEDAIHYATNGVTDFQNGKNVMESIRKTTESIISGKKTDDEKIRAIYAWIADNVSYDESVLDALNAGTLNKDDLSEGFDRNIFSGMGTFNNRVGVCQGYAKLFAYMLSYAGIKDVAIENGKANNGNYYVGHAWIRIGNLYYDVTFDETNDGVKNPFVWYALPKDVMYATRNYSDSTDWSSASSDALSAKIKSELGKTKGKYGNLRIYAYYGME